jgi:Na+/pantothenate symporter
MTRTSAITISVFVAYVVGVFIIAGLSHRILGKKSFLAEYFLGSRGLGTWALAFTFAATSASGGSFGGYPSLIYSHGWVLALWIASYMVFPLTSMGVIGKRLNEVARRTQAITIPDVFRDRYESPALGLLASATIIGFNSCFLLAQFKLGALIIEDTFNLRMGWAYEVSLIAFAVIVIFYTAYGGFRAVVWTDVMQGVVMGLGVVLLVPVVLSKVGGLPLATRQLQQRPPLLVTSVPGPDNTTGTFNDLVLRARGVTCPAGLRYARPTRRNSPLLLTWEGPDAPAGGWIEVTPASDDQRRVISTANDVKAALERHPELSRLLAVEFPYKNDQRTVVDGQTVSLGATGVLWFPPGTDEHRFVFVRGDELLFAPGRRNSGAPFHPLGMMISFFIFWPITGIAQPGTMVRLMAFKDSPTLRRSILTVTFYYAMIYLPLVVVVMAARSQLPVLTPEDSDRAIVLIATRLVAEMGLGYQVLGAVLIAAPFAAVMSTVDSFLLQISSSAVRDIYQRSINPQVSARVIKGASYAATVVVGLLVTLLAWRPPNFLQTIIVFGSTGFAASFLVPMVLGLYWPGMTRAGALAAMFGGLVVVVALTLGGVVLLGLHPVVWGLASSLALGVLVSKLSGPPPAHLVERYFCA